MALLPGHIDLAFRRRPVDCRLRTRRAWRHGFKLLLELEVYPDASDTRSTSVWATWPAGNFVDRFRVKGRAIRRRGHVVRIALYDRTQTDNQYKGLIPEDATHVLIYLE